MQWAVKAFEHAETFFSQLEKLTGSQTQASQTAIQRFRFTTPALDEEIYAHFRREFPDMPVAGFDEHLHFKSPERKKQWREFINVYEKSVEDYNFGSLLRVDPFQEYVVGQPFMSYTVSISLCISISISIYSCISVYHPIFVSTSLLPLCFYCDDLCLQLL